MIIIAHNIRSLYNVGTIFRNAAAFSVERLYLTGYTGRPPRKEIAKTALGAQDLVDWKEGEGLEVLRNLKAEGYTILGLDQHKKAVYLQEVTQKFDEAKLAIFLGNEVTGIEEEIRAELDGYIEIPMGKKKSLNVSVATGVMLYELTRQKFLEERGK